MFDLPFKLFPPALLAGVSIWGLASVLWMQPLVEERMAEKVLIPQCEASLLKAERAIPAPPPDPRKAQIKILETIFDEGGWGRVPIIEKTIAMTKNQIDATSPKRLRSSKIERDGVCACSVDKAFSDAFYPMALHVASLRTHVPSEVRTLDKTVLAVAASGACGAVPWMKG